MPGTEFSALARRLTAPLDKAHSTASSMLSNPFGRAAKIIDMLFNASIAVPSTTSIATRPTTLDPNSPPVAAALVAIAAPRLHPTSTTSPKRPDRLVSYSRSRSFTSVSMERSASSSAVVAPCARRSGATIQTGGRSSAASLAVPVVVDPPSAVLAASLPSSASASGANVRPLYPAPWTQRTNRGSPPAEREAFELDSQNSWR